MIQPVPSRRAGILLILALLGLNWLLFLPAFLFRGGQETDLLPFTPSAHPGGSYGFDLRSFIEYPKALLLRRANGDVFRVSVEFLLGVAVLVASARWRGARPIRVVLAALYTTFMVLLGYHHAYSHFYRVEPALWEDITLATSLLRYAQSELGTGALALMLLAAAALMTGLLVVALCVFGALQSSAQDRRSGVILAGLCGWALLSLAWFGTERDDPVIQLRGKVLKRNLDASLARRAKVLALRGAEPDQRYEPFMRARLSARPRVYLLMIEAYGQRVASDPLLRGTFQALAMRTMTRLGRNGFHARTAYSRAPIYGGRSWLSIGTVQTGVRIDQPSVYDEMAKVGGRIPTLTRFFKANGYRTLALQSGNTVKNDPNLFDAFQRDVVIEGPDLPYQGVRTGYGGVPDQYSLSWFRENVLAREAGPFFSFYMSVSTHFSWPQIPFVADWRALDGPQPAEPAPWVPLPGSARLPTEGFLGPYFGTIVYEWRALADFIEAEASQDAIFFVVGDHQPLIERTMDDVADLAKVQSLNTPVHVISRDAAFVERFAARGFVPGLFAEPGTGTLMHEGLFSLFVHEIVGHHGPRGETRFTSYYPEGAGLAAFGPQ